VGFSSITFLFYFLPIFLILYYVIPARNAVLLTASLFFYAWGEPIYVALLMGLVLVNYLFGIWLSHPVEGKSRRTGIAIAVNLAVLGWFKYAGFIATQLGIPALSSDPPHLPLGISFFTFHAISYLIDVSRGNAVAERSPMRLAIYITMFPQLVAGPIIRYKDIYRELKDRSIHLDAVASGIRLFAIGLGQKVLIADNLARCADQIFDLPASELIMTTAWLGVLSYMLQIYYDFSGYSHMAIGLARMIGFTFPENFNFPYTSRSITEFWQRWHMTLSTWFRDYVYIPLGGNRRGRANTYMNLWTVFALCGLWHGASWNFVIWGIYHGALLVWERTGGKALLRGLWAPLGHVYTLTAVALGWVLFRCNNLEHAFYFLKAIAGFGVEETAMNPPERFLSHGLMLALAVGVLCATPALAKAEQRLAARRPELATSLSSVVATAVFALAALAVASATYTPFIYFRF
jgi:alginate O-acetyltransferase complex protein AlgI